MSSPNVGPGVPSGEGTIKPKEEVQSPNPSAPFPGSKTEVGPGAPSGEGMKTNTAGGSK